MELKNIDIIVSEIDGIVTDGMKPIDHMNHTMFKNYCEKDFEAIKELKKFFTFVFLADDGDVSYNVMRTRNIPAFFVGGEPKLKILQNKIMSRYNMTPENLLYVGSKLSDVQCMNYAEISLTTTDSFLKTQQAATSVLETSAGKGVLSQLYEILSPELERRRRK